MIGIKEMYNIYIDSLRNNILNYDNMLFNLNNSKKYILEQLVSYELYINNFTKIKYKNIDSLILKINIEDDVFFDKVSNNAEEIANRVIFINLINHLSTLNSKINRINNEILKLKKRNQTYKVYKFIIGEFNKKTSIEILNGESLNLGFRLGSIRIQKKRRYKGDENVESFDPHNYKVVNLGESNKFKQELIDKGFIPYKAIKDENGKVIGDNGGHKWLIYFTDDFSYWWYWNKHNKDVNKAVGVRNVKKYSFLPTKGIIGNRVKLQNLLKTNPTAHLNFTM